VFCYILTPCTTQHTYINVLHCTALHCTTIADGCQSSFLKYLYATTLHYCSCCCMQMIQYILHRWCMLLLYCNHIVESNESIRFISNFSNGITVYSKVQYSTLLYLTWLIVLNKIKNKTRNTLEIEHPGPGLVQKPSCFSLFFLPILKKTRVRFRKTTHQQVYHCLLYCTRKPNQIKSNQIKHLTVQ
jgi:hypothetical protein